MAVVISVSIVKRSIVRLWEIFRPVIVVSMLGVSLNPGLGYAQSSVTTPSFQVIKYEIEGNEKVSADRLRDVVAPFTGEAKDFSTIQSAVSAIQAAYKAAGFEAVRVLIPKQEINNGIVHLQVVEAVLNSLLVQGNKYFDEDNVRHSLPALRSGEVPNIRELGANLRLSNESSAKQTQVTFRQGENPRAVDAVVGVADEQPWHAAISLDNTGTAQTGDWRLGFAFMHANLLNRDDAFSTQVVTSPGHWNDVKIFGLSYRIPLYALGDALEFSASHSSVNSGVVTTTAGSYGISGSGNNYGVRYVYLLPRISDWDQRVNLGLDYRIFRNHVKSQGSGENLVPDIEVHPLSATYVGFIRSPDRELGLTLGIHHNIPGGENGDQMAFDASRQNASPNYTIVRYGFNVTQNLPRDWQIRGEFNGQQTNDALVSGEQFGIGGINSVRGFEERSLANDRGHRGTLELHTPDFGSALPISDLRLRALTFVDTASARRNHLLSGEVATNHLTSVGVGLRGFIGSHAHLRLDLSHILDDGGLAASAKKYAQTSFIYLF